MEGAVIQILHVEDDWMKAKTVRTQVERAGIAFEITHVVCLADFEMQVSDPDNLPDLVITDWCFPMGREMREGDMEQPLNGGSVVATCAAVGLPCAVYSGYTRPSPDELCGAAWTPWPMDIPEWIRDRMRAREEEK
jgi:hypothetical protein